MKFTVEPHARSLVTMRSSSGYGVVSKYIVTAEYMNEILAIRRGGIKRGRTLVDSAETLFERNTSFDPNPLI